MSSPRFVSMLTKSRSMKLGLTGPALLLLIGAGASCATQHVTPPALVEAREEFSRAKNGVALQLDPTDVHEADLALQRAEAAFRDEPDDPTTTDLAVVADRRALIAETQAATMQAQEQARSAKQQGAEMTAAQLQSARGQLSHTQQALGQTQMQLQEQQVASAAQAQQLQDMQTKLKDARDTIAKIASVKDDDRGMVITLQGEVLFKTGKWDLKPTAMAKLDQIASALKGKEQPILVQGYTDNVGSLDMNMDLSQRRATAVRDYLASKGIPQDLITGEGKGPADPVSDNTSVEGRAQNRRVELVVKPKAPR
jgi:outer membrane protein OmpA-like peptidoglycan-associated protein